MLEYEEISLDQASVSSPQIKLLWQRYPQSWSTQILMPFDVLKDHLYSLHLMFSIRDLLRIVTSYYRQEPKLPALAPPIADCRDLFCRLQFRAPETVCADPIFDTSAKSMWCVPSLMIVPRHPNSPVWNGRGFTCSLDCGVLY
jgi:hypothetical protein